MVELRLIRGSMFDSNLRLVSGQMSLFTAEFHYLERAGADTNAWNWNSSKAGKCSAK